MIRPSNGGVRKRAYNITLIDTIQLLVCLLSPCKRKRQFSARQRLVDFHLESEIKFLNSFEVELSRGLFDIALEMEL